MGGELLIDAAVLDSITLESVIIEMGKCSLAVVAYDVEPDVSRNQRPTSLIMVVSRSCSTATDLAFFVLVAPKTRMTSHSNCLSNLFANLVSWSKS